ncbi:MAG: hypothetical protein IJQ89_00065 [Bacteroidales bacterium]|nr:hypothetical protein [Bacteroidales bacterium]
MKKASKIILISSIIVFLCCACWGHKEINGIEVSELLLVVSEEQNIDYCKLLNEATKGNESSIKEIALLDFSDGAAYDHGAVLVDLIEKIGEEKFVQSFKSLIVREKKWIKGFLEVGIEYGGNVNMQGQTLKDVFPKIYDFLNSAY